MHPFRSVAKASRSSTALSAPGRHAAARPHEDIDSCPRWPQEKTSRGATILYVAVRQSSHRKTTPVGLEEVSEENFPRSDSARCPLFYGGWTGGRPPPLATSLRRAGRLASPAFPRFVITFIIVTNCTTKETLRPGRRQLWPRGWRQLCASSIPLVGFRTLGARGRKRNC